MFAVVDIAWWHWVGFVACVVVFLALDLGVFHRRARVVKVREALGWTALWVGLAVLFGLALGAVRGQKESLQFYTGYLIEFSLSMDNVFVIALIFNCFSVPSALQHRVLFWGILGALVMRGLMIALGVALIALLHWMLYVLGRLRAVHRHQNDVCRNQGQSREKPRGPLGATALSGDAWPRRPEF